MPRGLRRTEPEHPGVGTQLGADTIKAPLEVDQLDPGHLVGTSNPAMLGGTYKDLADVPKSGEATVNKKVPFEVSKR